MPARAVRDEGVLVMETVLTVRAVHEGGMRFAAQARDHRVTLDYPLEPGEPGAGMRPLEALLASLAACSGSAVALLLKRQGQPLAGLEVVARGTRRAEHPTLFTSIHLDFVIRGEGVASEAVQQSLAMAEERLCPVWCLLRPGVPIVASFRIET